LRPVQTGIVAVLLVFTACQNPREKAAHEMTGGEPSRGREAIQRYGCGACHHIAGIDGATGQIGPPLDNIGDRVTLAGQLPNTPQNMIRWIREPQRVRSGTMMPDMNVGESDARDIAAYLYTLRP
jgi:cytochrome c2